MKRRIAVLSAGVAAMSLSLAAPVASAVDVGMGAGLNGGERGGTVYVPIRFGNLRLEPELSYFGSTADATYPTAPTNNFEQETSYLSLGTGIYRRQLIGTSVESYVGGRIGYFHNETSRAYPNAPASSYTTDLSGFYIGPTIGAEYFFHKQFSIGVDVSLIYSSGTQDYTPNSGAVSNSDETSLYTETRAALRFYFEP